MRRTKLMKFYFNSVCKMVDPDKLIICFTTFGETVADLFAALFLADMSNYRDHSLPNSCNVVIVTTGKDSKKRAENLCKLFVGPRYEVLYAPESSSWDFHPDYPNTAHHLFAPQEWQPEFGTAYSALSLLGQCQPLGTRMTELLSQCSAEHPAKVCICAPLAAHRLIPKELTANVTWYVTVNQRNLLENSNILDEFHERLAIHGQVARMIDASDEATHGRAYELQVNTSFRLTVIQWQAGRIEDVCETDVQKAIVAETQRLLPTKPDPESNEWGRAPGADVLTVGLAVHDMLGGAPSHRTIARGVYTPDLVFHESDNGALGKVKFTFLAHGDPAFLCMVAISRTFFGDDGND
jgi:hypothetical protein